MVVTTTKWTLGNYHRMIKVGLLKGRQVELLNMDVTRCFKAKGELDLNTVPDWLSVKFVLDARESRFYEVWVVPWIAEPAIALGALKLDGSPWAWVAHLESLGFEDVVQVSCLEFFGPRADRDR